MTDGYPFSSIVRDRETGHYVSIALLESDGASDELITLLVHGPLKDAVEMMAQWNPRLEIEANISLAEDE